MSELNFSSNADEIRYYLRVFLDDGKERNRKEINDYIRKTPNGHTFTEGMITGAIKSLIDTERGYYENIRRGWYRAKKNGEALKNGSASNTDLFTKRVHNILGDTINKLNDACTFNLLEFQGAEIEYNKVHKIAELIKYLDKFEKEFES